MEHGGHQLVDHVKVEARCTVEDTTSRINELLVSLASTKDCTTKKAIPNRVSVD